MCVADVIANFFGERVDVDVAFGRENHGAFYDVLEFADVSRPGILLQEFGGGGSKSGEIFCGAPD